MPDALFDWPAIAHINTTTVYAAELASGVAYSCSMNSMLDVSGIMLRILLSRRRAIAVTLGCAIEKRGKLQQEVVRDVDSILRQHAGRFGPPARATRLNRLALRPRESAAEECYCLTAPALTSCLRPSMLSTASVKHLKPQDSCLKPSARPVRCNALSYSLQLLFLDFGSRL